MSNEKTLNKIRALLAKTIENGCTEAEAMAALTMAQMMMNEHEVTLEDLELGDEKAIIARSDLKDPQNVRWKLCYWVAQFTDTYSFGHKKDVKYVGLKADVDFAIWLTDTLAMFVHAQLKSYMWANGYQRLQGARRNRVINSFVIGCCTRINTKIKTMIDERKPTSNGTALVVAKKALIDEATKDLGISEPDNRGRKNKIDAEVYKAGQEAGNRASFGRPVETGGMLRLEQK